MAIVVGHVWRGMAAAGIVPSDRTFVLVDRGLYFFHLAVFVFVAGLFVRHGVVKNGTGPYLRSRTWLFLYLYLIWGLLQGLVKVISGSLVNSPSSWWDLARLWIPEGQLWFLPFMVMMTVVGVTYRPWERPWPTVAAASLASLAAWGVEAIWAGGRGLSLTVFFVAGAALGARRFASAMAKVGPATALLLGSVLGAGYLALLLQTSAAPPTVSHLPREADSIALGVMATVLSTTAVLLVSKAMTAVPLLRHGLGFLGRRSLEIFLAHIIATAGTRIVLMRVGVTDPWVHVLTGTAAGVVGPLILWWVLTRIGSSRWLFSAPGLSPAPRATR